MSQKSETTQIWSTTEQLRHCDPSFLTTQQPSHKLCSCVQQHMDWYLCGEGLHRLQVEVVIQVKVIQVLSVDQQVQHVVALATHLQANFHPVQLGGLEKLGSLEGAEQVPGESRDHHQLNPLQRSAVPH